MSNLTPLDTAILDTAGRGFFSNSVRDRHIREELGLKPTAYFQLLNAMLDDPDALAYAPVTVNRLRRVRETNRERNRSRTA